MTLLKTYKALTILLASLLMGACATRSNSGSVAQYGLDQAAIFGSEVEEFVLPDGSQASIRKFNNNYSVKLQKHSRVVDIERATQVKFRSAQTVDGYTLIVLEKNERNCASKTHLLAIRGTEVRAWDFGNCRAWPQSAISGNAATFEVEEGAATIQYQFTGGRLLYGPLSKRPTPMPMPARQAPAEAQPSAMPAKSGETTAASLPRTGEAAAPASRKTSPAPYVPAPAPVFKPKEQAPRTIYLDK